jgi:hypothetical protein
MLPFQTINRNVEAAVIKPAMTAEIKSPITFAQAPPTRSIAKNDRTNPSYDAYGQPNDPIKGHVSKIWRRAHGQFAGRGAK